MSSSGLTSEGVGWLSKLLACSSVSMMVMLVLGCCWPGEDLLGLDAVVRVKRLVVSTTTPPTKHSAASLPDMKAFDDRHATLPCRLPWLA